MLRAFKKAQLKFRYFVITVIEEGICEVTCSKVRTHLWSAIVNLSGDWFLHHLHWFFCLVWARYRQVNKSIPLSSALWF